MAETGYDWLQYGTPGEGFMTASVFAFIEGLRAPQVVELSEMNDPRAVHLRDESEVQSCLWSIELGFAAVFEQDGWTVLYQDNGFPGQVADQIAARTEVSRAVIAFWNVNGLTELTYWEHGVQIAGYSDVPTNRLGTDYARFADELSAVGLAANDDISETMIDDQYQRMLAFADRVTGTHLEPDFLRRPGLTVGSIDL